MTHGTSSVGALASERVWRDPLASRWRYHLPAGRHDEPARPWWHRPGTVLVGAHDVHVWRVDLDHPGWPLEQLTGTLSLDERRRASTLAFSRDRRRMQVSRGVLRLLLAGYVDRAPRAIDLRDGPHGKPELAVASGDEGVMFNCSHSRGLALYAFAPGRRVGIDLEVVRHLPEAEAIAELCFSPRERSKLAALPRSRLDEAVLRGWTMKEAYAKAVGEGLTRPLDGVEVAVAPTEPPALHAIDGDRVAAGRWSLQTLSPEAGYVAALVAEGHGYELSCWAAQPSTPTRLAWLCGYPDLADEHPSVASGP